MTPTEATSTGASSTARSIDMSNATVANSTVATATTSAPAVIFSCFKIAIATSVDALGPARLEPRRYRSGVRQANYSSGNDFVVEFVGYRFSFNAADFEQRTVAAAVKLRLLPLSELEAEETADLVELVADERIAEPRSGLGRYLVRNWEKVSAQEGESLVYWLRKIVFRGAWLDHRVKERLLEIVWDEQQAEFAYRDPRGGRALLELAPVPSWQPLQFKRR